MREYIVETLKAKLPVYYVPYYISVTSSDSGTYVKISFSVDAKKDVFMISKAVLKNAISLILSAALEKINLMLREVGEDSISFDVFNSNISKACCFADINVSNIAKNRVSIVINIFFPGL